MSTTSPSQTQRTEESVDQNSAAKSRERCFERPEELIAKEIQRCRNLPRLTDALKGLNIFACTVDTCVATVKACNNVAYLHSPELISALLHKLTPILRHKYMDYAASRRCEATGIPELETFAEFLCVEADKAAKYVVYDTELQPAGRRASCAMCDGAHALPQCVRFKESSTDERWELAKNAKKCFKCLKGDHRVAQCPARTCDVDGCRQPHHWLLHYNRVENEAAEAANAESAAESGDNAVKGCGVYLQFAQVTVRGPGGDVDTFAVLGSSGVTLVETHIADRVGARGVAAPMRLAGIFGAPMSEPHSRRVKLQIRGRHEREWHVLSARTKDKVGLAMQRVDADTLRGCTHLQDIREQLMYDTAMPTILIGLDNAEVMEMRERRMGGENEPAAIRTNLGWAICGGGPPRGSSPAVIYTCFLADDDDDEPTHS